MTGKRKVRIGPRCRRGRGSASQWPASRCSCTPRTAAATSTPTARWVLPNERVLMIGFDGLLLTSATGENVRWIPTARPSIAVACRSVRDAGLAGGAHAHNVRKRCPAHDADPVPPSRSDAMSSGSPERRCRTLSLAAMSSGEPIETMMPPTWSESTQRRRPEKRTVVEGRVGAREPGDDELADLLATDSWASTLATDAGENGAGARPGPRPGGAARGHQREDDPSGAPHLPRGCRCDSRLQRSADAGGSGASRHRGAAQRLRSTWSAASAWPAHEPDRRRPLRTSDVDSCSRRRPAARGAVLSPEHGFRGAGGPARSRRTVDSATGLPIYSLYGGSRPSAPPRSTVDVLLIDLQDVGARYYTYPATATCVMTRTPPRLGQPVVVLDRPDPIGGALVAGDVRQAVGDPDSQLVGFLPVPMRHGMTLGELLRLANDVLALRADLVVVPAAGWRRDMAYRCHGTALDPSVAEHARSRERLSLPGDVPVRGHESVGGAGEPLWRSR